MKTAVMTDTNSGIMKAEADSMGIFLIPMPVIINDETHYEGIDLAVVFQPLHQRIYRALRYLHALGYPVDQLVAVTVASAQYRKNAQLQSSSF